MENNEVNIEYRVIARNNPDFRQICNYIEENIVKENLEENGGTLKMTGLVYQCPILIVAFADGNPIGFNAIKDRKYTGYFYISQIAVKNEFKRKGVAKKMMEILVELANETSVGVAAHAKQYNTPSVEMFKSLGFDQSTELTPGGSYTFVLNAMELEDKHVK